MLATYDNVEQLDENERVVIKHFLSFVVHNRLDLHFYTRTRNRTQIHRAFLPDNGKTKKEKF